MRLVVHLRQLSRCELGVALRRREPLVPEQFLNGAQVGTFLKQMSAKSVTKRVRMYICRESAADGDAFDDATHAASCETRLTAGHFQPAQLQTDKQSWRYRSEERRVG